MRLILNTAPTTEPLTLAEAKLFLRIDSGSFAGNTDETQSIAPGSHIVADNYTTHVGTSISVLGYSAIVYFQSGTNGTGGTVDVKIQESDDSSTWNDWTGGAFDQVTTANDNATYEKEYTGTKAYIRTVAKVLVASCEFGTTVMRLTATTIEDDLITSLIVASRQLVEKVTRRALITQIWDYYLDDWPEIDYINIPLGNLQNGESTAPVVTWKDSDGTETTLTVTTDYLVETNGKEVGRIVLPYGESWPDGQLYPSNPIKIHYYCGWTSADNVPDNIKLAMRMAIKDFYTNRSKNVIANIIQAYSENPTFQALLASERLMEEY